MLPKKGDIVKLTFGSFLDAWKGQTIIFVVDDIDNDMINFTPTYSESDNFCVGKPTYFGCHVLKNGGKWGGEDWCTWSSKEYNIINLLKRVDEISQGTT